MLQEIGELFPHRWIYYNADRKNIQYVFMPDAARPAII
jgi:hypothetical protein